MLKIRLSRTGKKSQPSYRILVQEHTAAPQGKAIEILGHYRPTMNPKEFLVNLERAKYWISVGAQPSDTLATLLKNQGMEGMERYMEPRNKKRKSKKAVAEAPAVVAAPVAVVVEKVVEVVEEAAPTVEEVAPVVEEAAPVVEEAQEEAPAEAKEV